eukprot:1161925-Pelagomonas_calceolata.AAC.3
MEPQAAGELADRRAQPHARRFAVIVHVQSDFAFKKYLDNCSNSDLMLYRGLLLEVSAGLTLLEFLHAIVTAGGWRKGYAKGWPVERHISRQDIGRFGQQHEKTTLSTFYLRH